MKDGFYLSTYLTPVGLPRLLDIWVRHDNAVALWEKAGSRVTLVHYWELERLTGTKEHGTGFWTADEQASFLNRLLAEYNLRLDDICDVWGSPDIGHSLWRPVAPQGLAIHAVAHAYSALMVDTQLLRESPALVIAVDGGPDDVLETNNPRSWYAGAFHRPGEPLRWFSIASPGMLYYAAKARFRMREGSLMALSSATRARSQFDAKTLLIAADLRGAAAEAHAFRIVDTITDSVRRNGIVTSCREDRRFTREELEISAIMKAIDDAARSIMRQNIWTALQDSGTEATVCFLGLSGGFALNCPTNTALIDEFGFRGLLAPPAVNDSGQALGIGLWAFSDLAGGPELVDFELGSAFHGADVVAEEELRRYSDYIDEVASWDPATFVDDIQRGPLAWVEGRAEIGPRALGHRSLLADPRSEESKKMLNELKRREWWRPVAPIVLAEYAAEWFELRRESPYMLEAPRVIRAQSRRIPAVVHLDGTARVQTLRRAHSPLLYDALKAFHDRTGVPILCNTSLNDKGEPIVNTVGEALTFALRKKLPICYINGHRVLLRRTVGDLDIAKRPFSDVFAGAQPEGLRQRLNPGDLDEVHLYVWLKTPALRRRYDIADPVAARALRQVVDALLERSPYQREVVAQKIRLRRIGP